MTKLWQIYGAARPRSPLAAHLQAMARLVLLVAGGRASGSARGAGPSAFEERRKYRPLASLKSIDLSPILGDLCAQPGVLSLQRLDPGLTLLLEGAPPFGKLRLAEELEPALPVEQVARNGA